MSETFEAHRCENGHLSYPGHTRCPDCGEAQTETVDLTDETATVITWTTSTATPPGVRQPNTLGIVEFDVDAERVRALGQFTTDDIEIGQIVTPVYTRKLRDPDAGIRHPDSQEWDGFRFEPVE